MSRIRTVKPEFQLSESMGRISRDARLLFIELWTFADDSGRARGNSRMLASVLFPFDADAPDLIDAWLSELEHEGCVVRYLNDGNCYIQVTNWEKHQKIDKPTPSKFPPPPEKSENSDVPLESSSNIREKSNTDLGPRTLEPRTIIRDANASLGNGDPLPPEPIKVDRLKDEERDRLRAFGSAWNALAADIGLPQIEEIKPGSTRERHALARLREISSHDELIAKIRGSPYLRGEINGFRCTFDWITNAANCQKIMEGNYEDRAPPRQGFSAGRPANRRYG